LFHNLKHKLEKFHEHHPHPIKEFIEHHRHHIEDSPSKKELLKELMAVKKQMATNMLKLEADKKFVEMDDKLITVTKEKLAELEKSGATKEQIASVKAALDVEMVKEAEAKKDEVAETDLITKEKAEAAKLWEEIKNLPGSEEKGDTPTKKELMKKLYAVKKQLWANEMKIKAEDQLVKYDEQVIAETKTKLAELKKKGAPQKEIDAVTQALKLEVEKEGEIQKDEATRKELVTKEQAEVKEIIEEIKNLPNAEDQYKMDVIKLEQIVDGILRGALDAENLTDISTCITDMETIFGEAETAVGDFEKGGLTNIVAGLKELGGIFQNVETDMADCSAAKEDWPRLKALAEVFKSPKTFAYHVGKDLLVNGKDIYHEITDSVTEYKAENWEQFGLDVGTAAAKTILGDEEPEQEEDVEIVMDDDLFLY
jgi:hypothetical protein